MFKNAIAFLVTPGFKIDAELLARVPAMPCNPTQSRTAGFAQPCSHATDDYVHHVAGYSVICLETEDRLLPGSVVAQEIAERCAALTEKQGFKPGRGQMREIKDQVLAELLPKAFTQRKRTYAVFAGPYFIIDTSSPARADLVIETLGRALDAIPLTSIRTNEPVTKEMINWLLGDRPGLLSVDRFAELEKAEEGKPAIAYKRTNLDEIEMRRRVTEGYIPRTLAVTYNDRISFKLDENLHLKQLSLLDVIRVDATKDATCPEEVFDADIALAGGEMIDTLNYLISEFGGLQEPEADLLDRENPANEADSEDPMYSQAVAIVVENQRASISLVQRHLRIGYNRTARLIEDMESAGIVSQMDASGARRVLVSAERKAA